MEQELVMISLLDRVVNLTVDEPHVQVAVLQLASGTTWTVIGKVAVPDHAMV